MALLNERSVFHGYSLVMNAERVVVVRMVDAGWWTKATVWLLFCCYYGVADFLVVDAIILAFLLQKYSL